MRYNIKIIKTGKYTEMYIYNREFTRKEKKEKDDLKVLLDEWVKETMLEELKEKEARPLNEQELKALEKLKKKNKQRNDVSIKKSKKALRRLINSNLGQYNQKDKFLTLTYAGEMKDREKAFEDLEVFIRTLRRNYGKDIQYIGVMEIQDGSRLKEKTKATNNIHWHLLIFDMPYVQQSILQKKWKHGIVDIRQIKQFGDVAGYLVNYLGDDELLSKRQKKAYTSSKGLKRPKEVLTSDPLEISKLLDEEKGKMIFTSKFKNEYVGEFTYFKIENHEIERL